MRKVRQGAGCVSLILLSLLFYSCPQPITVTHVDGARDTILPQISISAPTEYSGYSRLIVIEGTVSDQTVDGRPGKIQALTYEILSHTAEKTALVGADGTFRIEEPNDLVENIVILIRAIDWNGNIAEYRLPLTYPGNEIPSFSSVEGNRQVTLTWDPVPGVVSYRLLLEPSAKSPDPDTSAAIEGITSPYVVTQLKNASLYSFLLEGTGADGRKNYSAVVRSIPLSTLHLLPRTTEFFNGINVDWRPYSALPGYEVLRAEHPDGPWESVSGPIAGPPFKDSSAVRGTTYYYAVTASGNSSVQSEWVEARTDPAASRSDASVASFSGLSNARGSVWRDGYLYIADYDEGLTVLDVSEPSFPRLAGTVALSQARDVFLQGDYAFVTGWKSLYIIDISDPTDPVETAAVEISASDDFYTEGLAVHGDLAFVAGFNDGFAVIDVSDKASPVVRLTDVDGDLYRQNYEAAVLQQGETVLLALVGIDFTALYEVGGTAAAPILTRLSSSMSGGDEAVFVEDTIYIASGWYLYAYDVSTPSAPVELDYLDVSGTVAGTNSVAVVGNRAFVALYDYGYAVVDISDPADLETVRIQTVPGEVRSVSVGGGYAYVSSGRDYDFQIYGADDPSAAVLALTKNDAVAAARIAAHRGFIWLAEFRDGDWHASSYDISNPEATFRLNEEIGYYTPYDFAFAGERSYIAAERSGIMQWDASDPGNPTVLPPWYVSVPGGNAWTIELYSHFALVGTSNSRLVSVDLSRPDSFTVVGSAQTQPTIGPDTEARGIGIYRNYAFVANEDAGLRVVDITDPSFPIALDGYGAVSGSAAAIAMAGSYALVADDANGLVVFDATNAGSWGAGQASVWDDGSATGATDVAVRGNYAYVAKGAAGLDVWDISNPRVPVSAGNLSAVGFEPRRIVLYGEYLYAIDGGNNLYVVDLVP